MGDCALYRSSSPVNPAINRNKEADVALGRAEICTVMNLADTETILLDYEGYTDSNYRRCDVIPLNLALSYSSDDFRSGLAKGFSFLAAHEGPYLVHCNEGKDRAGFVSALLECLMGASADEVVADYMVSFYNYYGVEPGSEIYDSLLQNNIIKSLSTAFNVENLWKADLPASAEEYMRGIGLGNETIATLKDHLGRDYSVAVAKSPG